MLSCLIASALFAAAPDGGTERLFDAARLGDVAAIGVLLDAGVAPDARVAGGATPLMIAALNGHARAVDALLSGGASVDARNAQRATALLWGVAHPDVARVLLAHDANPNAQAASGHTPLMVAALSDASTGTLALLVHHGASVNLATPAGFTPLMAATNATRDGVDALLSRGADAGAVVVNGWTALHGAATRGDDGMVETLLGHGASATAAETANHTTPLLWAAARGADRSVTALLGRGADVNARESFHGDTALVWAAAERHASTVRLLLKAGADAKATDEDGETALDWARRAGASDVVAALGASAQPPADAGRPSTPATWHDAIARSVVLLQRTGPEFVTQAADHCVSCHHQSLPAMALEMAREHGFETDALAARVQREAALVELAPRRERLLLGVGMPDPLDPGYLLVGLRAAGAPADDTTDALAHYLALHQQADGRWRALLHRPPMDDSDVTSTAISARALQSYVPRGREEEMARRVARATDWLATTHPRDTEEQAMQVLGLTWLGGHRDAVKRGRSALLSQQRADGGWAQLPTLPSDAYATGQVLVALARAGLSPTDGAARRGVDFLLSHQEPDSSWHVRTRSLPVQPYFESGFPHGRDQFISCAATAWATMGLLSSIE